MKQDSLGIAIERIINTIEYSNIDTIDKLELMINLYSFLQDYNENIEYMRNKTLNRK